MIETPQDANYFTGRMQETTHVANYSTGEILENFYYANYSTSGKLEIPQDALKLILKLFTPPQEGWKALRILITPLA